jgi:teichuronic acid biosynthesis glycosyltransferase TuaH
VADRLDGTRADLVVYFSASWWEGPRGTDRHMAEALSRYAPVLYVQPPVSVLTRLNRPDLAGLMQGPPLQVHGPRLAHLVTPVVPGQSRPGLHRLVPPLVRKGARDAIARLYGSRERDPVAAVVTSRMEYLGDPLPARRKLFYATDDFASGADILGVPRERLIRGQARTLRWADAVAVVSIALRDRYAEAGVSAHVVPNGCEPEMYSTVDETPYPTDVDLPGPVAGLVGHINDRLDLALLEAVADTGCSVLIVGPLASGYHAERFNALTDRPNVRWVGPKPYEQMPSYLRLIDVGLTPYVDNAFNRASFPLKTLEYLSAGRAAVATPLPATLWLDTDLIATARGPAEFAAAVTTALAQPRTAELAAQRRAFASGHSWHTRAADLAALLGLTQPFASATHPVR